MKYILLFLLCLCISRQSFSQKEKPATQKVYKKVNVEATYPGGLNAWKEYLTRSAELQKASEIAVETMEVGKYTVIVQFIVDKNGNVSDVEALTNHGHGLEEGAVEVIKKSGKWIPGKVNGRNVNSYKKQPIVFVFEEEEGDPA